MATGCIARIETNLAVEFVVMLIKTFLLKWQALKEFPMTVK